MSPSDLLLCGHDVMEKFASSTRDAYLGLDVCNLLGSISSKSEIDEAILCGFEKSLYG